MYLRFLLLLFVFIPSLGFGCSCNGPKEINEYSIMFAYCNSDLMFEGKVDSSERLDAVFTQYKIWPLNVYRGKPKAPTYTNSGFPHGPCSWPFRVKHSYLIFGKFRNDAGEWDASICGLTGPIQDLGVWKQLLQEAAMAETDPCSDIEVKKRWRRFEEEKNQKYRKLIRESLSLLNKTDEESSAEN